MARKKTIVAPMLPPQNASGNCVKVVKRLPARVRRLPHDGGSPLRAGSTATVASIGDASAISVISSARTSASAASPRQ